jgi:tripartite-type tricarboxylate transporter receptor subunit TctC
MISRRALLLSSGASLSLSPFIAFGQPGGWTPLRPITWVLPYPPGGFGDAVSRVLAQQLAKTLNVPVVVDNRPGGGGQIAAAYVKRQPADGHTLFNGDVGTFAMNAALYPSLNYDTLRDFAPVTRLLESALVLVVSSSSPLQTFDDLVKAAKSTRQDRPLMYGSFGIGSQPHLWMELFKREIRGQLEHVPYQGAAPAVQHVMGGHIDVMLDIAANSMPYVFEGKLRALAVVGSEERLTRLPHAPTMKELGYSTLSSPSWNGLVVRAGTAESIVNRLHDAVRHAVESDEVHRRYRDLGIAPALQSPSAFAKYIQAETHRWGSIARSAGVALHSP